MCDQKEVPPRPQRELTTIGEIEKPGLKSEAREERNVSAGTETSGVDREQLDSPSRHCSDTTRGVEHRRSLRGELSAVVLKTLERWLSQPRSWRLGPRALLPSQLHARGELRPVAAEGRAVAAVPIGFPEYRGAADFDDADLLVMGENAEGETSYR